MWSGLFYLAVRRRKVFLGCPFGTLIWLIGNDSFDFHRAIKNNQGQSLKSTNHSSNFAEDFFT
jgi:hypothetical protein